MGQLFGSLLVVALGTGLWFVALNKKARRSAALNLRGVRRDNAEDVATAQALVQGLGLVFGIFLQLVGLLGLIQFFQGGPLN